MKNKFQVEAAAPANAVQPSSNYNYNRELPLHSVLARLKQELPRQYELAEIVGQWIWLELPKTGQQVIKTLHRLGFHWNQRRHVWQHPCGVCAPFATHPQDPRIKYGSYFIADRQPA